MELKVTDKGHEFIEVDCQYKDFESEFSCDGKIRLIRFLYKKGTPLKIESLLIGKNEIEWQRVHYSTMDYHYHLIGLVDLTVDVEFEKGEKLVLKQFNKPNTTLEDGTKVNWDRDRNMVEKIQLYFERK